MQTWAIIWDTFRESRNSRLFWVLILISSVFVAALASIGFDRTGVSFFGIWHVDHPVLQLGRPEVASFYGAIVSYLLVDLYIGWVGVALSLIATCAMFPSIMAAGSVELLLSKPMPRWKLFIAKYLGALGFVAVQATYLVILVILVIGVRSGEWIWGCLWCIPLLVILFSYIYCIAVLVAVYNPSSLTCLVAALAFWFFCFLAQASDQLFQMDRPMVVSVQSAQEEHSPPTATPELPESPYASPAFDRIRTAVRATYHLLPKTGEISVICGRVVKAAGISDIVGYFDSGSAPSSTDMDSIRSAEKVDARVDPLRSLLSSLAFEFVILALACWKFCRRDF